MSALDHPMVAGAAPAQLTADGAISHSRLYRARVKERPGLRLAAVTALAGYGAVRWGRLMSPAPGWRLAALTALAVAIFAVGTGSLPFPRIVMRLRKAAAERALVGWLSSGWRRRLLVALAVLFCVGATFALSGIPVLWLLRLRIAVIAQGIGAGLSALPGALVPYLGINPWVRIVIVLGAALLLVSSALTMALARRLPSELRRACGALPLTALAVIPMTIIHPQLPYLQGLLLFFLLAAFMWGERLFTRSWGTALALLSSAGLLAAVLAPALHQQRAWLNYESLASALAPTHLDSFNWTQQYGPYRWPRHDREVLAVKAVHPDYWKAENLDVFDGFGWTQGAGPITASPPAPARWAVRRWSQTITVTIDRMKTNNIITAGFARRPAHIGAGVAAGESAGTWVASTSLRPGETYAVRTYSPRPAAAKLAAIPASSYPDASVADYRVVGLPLSAQAPYAQPVVEFPPFHSGGPVLNLASPYGAIGGQLVRHSPYARAYALARSLAGRAATPYAFVTAVERYLSTANGFRYDEHPPLSHFPLVSFLFSNRRGYCQHFAGAMALLLRMGGLPARVAAGFAPGRYDAANGTYTVFDRDAHAWVEVWFPHYGWVRFDPTPAIAPAVSDSANAGLLRAGTYRRPSPVTARRQGNLNSRALGSRGGGQSGSGLLLEAGLPLLLALTAAAGAWYWRRRTSCELLIAELERGLARCGRPARDGMTLHALERRFYESSAAVAYLRRLRLARYGRVSELPTPPQRRALRAQLAAGLGPWGWLRAWWALPPRRLR